MNRIFVYNDFNCKLEGLTVNITYLDNSATTVVCEPAAEKAAYMMTRCFGNPSSLHRLGFEAEKELTAARQAVGELIGAPAADIVFTSGGTEANNLAVFGAVAALKRRGNHIVTTAVEHSSVAAACDQLEKEGYSVTRLIPDENGVISPAQIANACTDKTILVTVMLVNNETGARFPLEKAVPMIRKKSPVAFIHCDAVQAAGKIPVQALRWQVDGMTVSAHKIHGPKGVGALYLRKGARILPRQVGGKQERSLRSGTESPPLIAAFGEACKALPLVTEQTQHFQGLKQLLLQRLGENPGVKFHLPEGGVPYIIHLSVPGYRSETILHFLSERNIFVSSGSACAKGAKSPVLTAMGYPASEIDSAIRVSLCHHNTADDIHRFADALLDAMENLASNRS